MTPTLQHVDVGFDHACRRPCCYTAAIRRADARVWLGEVIARTCAVRKLVTGSPSPVGPSSLPLYPPTFSVDRELVRQREGRRDRRLPTPWPWYRPRSGGSAEVAVSELDGEKKKAIELVTAEDPPWPCPSLSQPSTPEQLFFRSDWPTRATDYKTSSPPLRGGGAGEGERGRKNRRSPILTALMLFMNALPCLLEGRFRIGTSGNCLVSEYERGGSQFVTPPLLAARGTPQGSASAGLWVGVRPSGAGREASRGRDLLARLGAAS